MSWAIAANVGGQLLGGLAQGQKSREDARERARQLAEEQRQFNARLGEDQRQFGVTSGQRQFDQNLSANTQYGDRAQNVNRELETLPMRDKAQALLLQRMGAPAQQTTARSLAGGGTDALRGGAAPAMPYDLNAFKAQAEAYKPGDGGMSGDVQRQLLARYMNVPTAPDVASQPAPTIQRSTAESDQIRARLATEKNPQARMVLEDLLRRVVAGEASR